MKIIAVTSVKGGSGSTTTTAHLGTALHAMGLPVLLIDLCRTNLLRLHLGMDWADKDRSEQDLDDKISGNTLIQNSPDGTAFIPFRNDILTTVISDSLNDLLEKMEISDECIVILDCPSLNSQVNKAVSQLAWQTLLVMTADPACYASLHNYVFAAEDTKCLVNRFNPMMTLESDIFDLLLADYPRLMLPFNIHRDEFVRQALAHKQTALSYAPHSQAAHDYSALADWLISLKSAEGVDG